MIEDSLYGISSMLGDVAAMPDFLTKAVCLSQPSNIQIQKTGAEGWFNSRNRSPLLIWGVGRKIGSNLSPLPLEKAMHIFPTPPKEATKALLASCSLPTQDLTDRHFEHFFGCGDKRNPAGVVGLEVLGSVGLLRSLAVAEAARGSGCGKRLIQVIENHAASQGIEDLYLLTSTARALFESVGYQAASRDTAPPALRATAEFSSICPASATLMHKRIAA